MKTNMKPDSTEIAEILSFQKSLLNLVSQEGEDNVSLRALRAALVQKTEQLDNWVRQVNVKRA